MSSRIRSGVANLLQNEKTKQICDQVPSAAICYTYNMKCIGIVEIPKGCDRRIHKSNENGEFIDFGPIKDVIQVNDGKIPVCYGFLKGVMNETEGDEVDVLIFSNNEYKTGDEVEVDIIGMINRDDGDHKIIGKDSTSLITNIEDIDKAEWKLILDYFGFKHKIISVLKKEKAIDYITYCATV